jgi:hypothetical protein
MSRHIIFNKRCVNRVFTRVKKGVYIVKKSALFLILTLFAAMPALAVKYVAVVETEVDAQSGAAAELTPAEIRLITAELRREAVKNLPPPAYNIMTSETVIAQGSATLEQCFDENCVISLGSKIGADYIVRGTISKFKTRLTLTVEMYETEDGNLVASSEPVRSENAAELLEKAAVACAGMYKEFVKTQSPAAQSPTAESPPPKQPANRTVTAAVNPKANFAKEPKPKPEPKPAKTTANDRRMDETPQERGAMTGFSLGCGFHPNEANGHLSVYAGAAHSRPIFKETVLFNIEGNIAGGGAYNGATYGFLGFNVPLTVSLRYEYVFVEAGAHGDAVFCDGETVFNAGLTVGAGVDVGFGRGKKRAMRYFYRYNGGYSYGEHVTGMRWMF